jgi:hypothetical protein
MKRWTRFGILSSTLKELGREAADPELYRAKTMALDSRVFWEKVPIEKLVRHGFQMWKRARTFRILPPEDIALRNRIRGGEREVCLKIR